MFFIADVGSTDLAARRIGVSFRGTNVYELRDLSFRLASMSCHNPQLLMSFSVVKYVQKVDNYEHFIISQTNFMSKKSINIK